jgi:hypothetical protein
LQATRIQAAQSMLCETPHSSPSVRPLQGKGMIISREYLTFKLNV